MGIEDRDYYRDARPTGWNAIPPVCKWLIIVNILVFVLQIFVTRQPRREDLKTYLHEFKDADEEASEDDLPFFSHLPQISVVQEWLQLETHKVLRGQLWRLLTNTFCHDRLGVWHLLFNMLFLYWFGMSLESMYGSREFLLFYLTAAIIASLAYVGLDLATGGSAPAIGASGAVMAVTMLYAIHYPRTVIYVMLIIPVEVRWLVLFYVIFDLHPVLLALAGDRMFTGVAHAAHLGGLAFGFIYWKLDLRLEAYVDRLRFPRWDRVIGPRRAFRVYRPTQDDVQTELNAQVDEILRKLHDHGEASLTDSERQILVAASRRYKKGNR